MAVYFKRKKRIFSAAKNKKNPLIFIFFRQIKTLTWPRESHGLFDYESKTLVKDSLKLSQSGEDKINFAKKKYKDHLIIGKIVRNKDNVKMVKEKVMNVK